MLGEETEPLVNIDQATYEMMQNAINFEQLDHIIVPHGVGGSNDLMDPMMINILNSTDDTTLSVGSMEDYKYIQDASFIQYPPIEQLPFPPSEPLELCNTDYAGPFNFEVFVDPNVMKTPWEYSSDLQKIYIDMKHKFPINFSVKDEIAQGSLFIRIMPRFEEDRYCQELVHRCICHEQSKDPINNGISDLVAQHIIRCDNKNAQYFGNKNAGQRLSMVIPLSRPQAGTDSVKEFFYFVCKNSCVGGMNRKPIQVVFTLENECGNILGRRVLCVRICSCPKRDREKEEKKRGQFENPPPESKKKRIDKKSVPPTNENNDTTVYPLNINIVGKENYKLALKYCQTLMSNGIFEATSGNVAPFKKCREELTELLTQIPE